MSTREKGRRSKYQWPRSLIKTNPIYILTIKSVATRDVPSFAFTKSQSAMTVWVTMNPIKSWKIIITMNWLFGGIFLGIGKCLIHTFPIGVIGLYQSHPSTKKRRVPPRRIPWYTNGSNISQMKSIKVRVRKYKSTYSLSTKCKILQDETHPRSLIYLQIRRIASPILALSSSHSGHSGGGNLLIVWRISNPWNLLYNRVFISRGMSLANRLS